MVAFLNCLTLFVKCMFNDSTVFELLVFFLSQNTFFISATRHTHTLFRIVSAVEPISTVSLDFKMTSSHSVGDFTDPQVALWSSQSFHLLSSVKLSGPLHEATFSPSAAHQLAGVGSVGVYFFLIHEHGLNVELKVNDLR